MNQDILISIIVPVYNTEKYLDKCITSIIASSYEKLQIILVDDGSTDGSGVICDSYAAKDPRILVIHKENGGSSAARNEGLKVAKGDYYGFVDSDDSISQDMYELLMEAISRTGAKIAQAGRYEIAPDGRQLPLICIPPKQETTYSSMEFLQELLMHRGDCSFCTKLLSKELFLNREFPTGALNEDFRLLIEILKDTDGLVSIPKQTYYVLYREGSNTRKTNEKFSRVFADSVDNADWVTKLVRENYPQLLPQALRFGLFQRMEYLLHIPIHQMEKSNREYGQVVAHIRKNSSQIFFNKYLTGKNRLYLILFAICPKLTRIVHRKLRRL